MDVLLVVDMQAGLLKNLPAKDILGRNIFSGGPTTGQLPLIAMVPSEQNFPQRGNNNGFERRRDGVPPGFGVDHRAESSPISQTPQARRLRRL